MSKKFLLVQWDQYGTGINYNKDTTLTIDDYVAMLHDLVLLLEANYPNRKIFLYGMSWGTILTTKMANQMPDKMDGLISYGSFTNIRVWKQTMNDKLHKLELSPKEKVRLENGMSDTSNNGFKTVLNMASSKTSLYFYKGNEASNWDFYMHSFHVLVSPDYSLLDAVHAYSNPSGDSLMYHHVMHVDMRAEQLSINIPVLLLKGEDDLIKPVAYNEKLVKLNKNLSFKIFKHAGHIPTNKSYDEMFHAIIAFTDKITEHES